MLPLLAAVMLYATTPGAVASRNYAVSAGGKPLFVERFKDVSYARCAADGPTTVNVTLPSSAPATVSPLAYGIAAHQAGRQLVFEAQLGNHPLDLIIQTPGQAEKLFIFFDAPEARPAPLLSLADFATDSSGRTFQTAQIQKAIDTVAERGGGTLLVPDGKYLTGTFSLRSGVTLYLSSGALIQGSADPRDYRRALVLFENCQNAWIAGRGVLASSGTEIKRVTAQKPRMCEMIDCEHCGIRDVVIRDCAGFNIHVLHSRNILLSGYRIVNDLRLPNQDGTDPDGSDGVVVDGVFMYTSDDAIAVKADHGLCQNVVVKNCVFWTKKSALKIGSDPYFGARNIVFENDAVIHADRALALYSGKGFIENVRFLRDSSEEVGGDAKRQLIVFQVSKAKEHESNPDRRGVGFIRNVEVIDYTAYRWSRNPSVIEGVVADDGSVHSVSDVVFRGLTIAGTRCLSAAAARIQVDRGGVSGIATVRNLRFE
jgi:hypothetical protein